MSYLYGLDCPECKHDNVAAYRLRLKVWRGRECLGCFGSGDPFVGFNVFTAARELGWYRCMRCRDEFGQPLEWHAEWVSERNDLIFRKNQIESAIGQMYMLGWDNPRPDDPYVLERHLDKRHSLPFGFEKRFMELKSESMPRTAMYFRWDPMLEQNPMLTPDKVFQCAFSPGASAEERRSACEIRLPEDDLRLVLMGNPLATDSTNSSQSRIRCQHCGVPLPLKALHTNALREVQKGD